MDRLPAICGMFYSTLLLARHRSPELLKIFSLYPDGIPLKIAAAVAV
jgi:hypothetical protein